MMLRDKIENLIRVVESHDPNSSVVFDHTFALLLLHTAKNYLCFVQTQAEVMEELMPMHEAKKAARSGKARATAEKPLEAKKRTTH